MIMGIAVYDEEVAEDVTYLKKRGYKICTDCNRQ